jgi:hypothetical protein
MTTPSPKALFALFTLFISLICISTQAYAQEANLTPAKHDAKVIINSVSSKFTAYDNKVGRVSMTKVKPLSVHSKNTREKTSYFIGISILTQKDVMFSPGIGAGFRF